MELIVLNPSKEFIRKLIDLKLIDKKHKDIEQINMNFQSYQDVLEIIQYF